MTDQKHLDMLWYDYMYLKSVQVFFICHSITHKVFYSVIYEDI